MLASEGGESPPGASGMRLGEVRSADIRRVREGALEIDAAATLEEAALAIVRAAMDLAPCDHGGYSEVDEHFGRARFHSSEPEVERWVAKRADLWRRFMPDHPVLRFRQANPDIPVVRLSDVTDLGAFYGSGIYRELFREVETDRQITLHLGFDPKDGRKTGALPLALGVPLNRKGRKDFSDREAQALTLLALFARPALRRKRAAHQVRLLDAAEPGPELTASLVRLGLTQRQAEVAFWMLKGKSNTDIGAILDISPQTARQHSIAIFARLGVGGRLAMQRAVIAALSDLG